MQTFFGIVISFIEGKKMTLQEVLNHYGTGYKFAKATKISTNSFYDWVKRGYIPIGSQMKIERLTKGLLKANLSHVSKDDL
jgi:hypothetical protein